MTHEEEKGPILSVVGFVTAEDHVLLIRHSIREAWEMPGGKMRRGETIREALRREVLEEAGVDIDTALGYTTGPTIEQDASRNVVALIYRVGLTFMVEPKAGSDATKAAWFRPRELPHPLSKLTSAHIIQAWSAEQGRHR